MKQGRKSTIGGFCKYRGANGRKCAAGHLISNKDYSKEMEGFSCGCDLVSKAIRGHDLPLVVKLQRVHDDFFARNWKEEFKRVANDYGLKFKF